MLVVVRAVRLHLRRQDFDGGEVKGVGGWGLSRRGEGQFVVVVVVVRVSSQAGLYMPWKLRHCQGHLVAAQAGARRHLITPQLEHPRCGASPPFIGNPGSLQPHTAAACLPRLTPC